ncbi:G2/M phase-specific E3 ubiquitin-protein ligase-like isoform X2 [Epinephelus lanceolatus]
MRKMSALPFEAEGYTGAMLRNISDGGKRTLYIVPLQDELDLSPLPANAPEFALMPKASCKHCSVEMPVQMLVLHDRKCASQMISDDDNNKFSECLQTPVPGQTEEDHCPQQEEDVQCPICSNIFPVLLIEEHVSHCGQRTKDTTSPERELHTAMDDISCEEDVVMWLKAKVDSSKTFELCVSRDNMLERGFKMWKRKQKATPLNPLRMKFLGEAGIDTGALRKEFLTTMVSGIEQRLFEGGKSKMPKYSVNDFAEELFRTAGEIFATSIAQGGPAPRFLQPWCYEFLASGKLSLDHVLDPSLSPLITTVAEASDLTDYTADILDCGYTGKIDMKHKENILIAIGLHVMTKRMPMLQQLREGLDIYGFSQVMQAKTEECRSLFVAGDDESVDSHYITSHLVPEMSERGCNKQRKEILEHFQDFLHELEVAEPDATSEDTPTVPSVMQWITGQAHRHLLLSDRQNFKITVKFDHDCHNMPNHIICYPTVSACTDTITFPVAHVRL